MTHHSPLDQLCANWWIYYMCELTNLTLTEGLLFKSIDFLCHITSILFLNVFVNIVMFLNVLHFFLPSCFLTLNAVRQLTHYPPNNEWFVICQVHPNWSVGHNLYHYQSKVMVEPVFCLAPTVSELIRHPLLHLLNHLILL